MQPFIFISGETDSIVYVNGRLWGKCSEDELCVPISPTGAVYLEIKPTKPGYLPIARTIAVSKGRLVAGSVSSGRGLSIVTWPGGAIQIHMEPEPIGGYKDVDGEVEVFSDSVTRRTLTPLCDVAGHALSRVYQFRQGIWELAQSEIMWAQSGPFWPSSPEDTAIAAVQASLLGLGAECAGYVLPDRSYLTEEISRLNGVYDGCCKAAYCPDKNAVALVKVVNDNLAEVTLADYSCQRSPGLQGEWRLESFAPRA